VDSRKEQEVRSERAVPIPSSSVEALGKRLGASTCELMYNKAHAEY